MKNILQILSLCIAYTLQAQIGINTDTPRADLDVNGDLNIRGKVHLGGAEGTLASPGVNGQVLVSSGPGAAPKWLMLNIPDGEEKFYLIYNNTFEDNVGVQFTSAENTGNNIYLKGTLLSTLTNWKKIPNLTKTFEVYSAQNKTYFTFETVAQIATTGLASNVLDAVEYACGIFVDGKLEGVRVNVVEQPSIAYGSFKTLTMMHVSENIPIGTHTLDVACTRRAQYSTTVNLGVGRYVNSNNLNNFMAKSTMKIEVFEIPDNYIAVDP
ncbi:hypothetical protein [Moheibacter stercoris]|uniref:Uncharacterized protein n=1 Tax=Moheibacter stercoris TaxID=1628251 RepID=A0ABV2LZ76_9FLAO